MNKALLLFKVSFLFLVILVIEACSSVSSQHSHSIPRAEVEAASQKDVSVPSVNEQETRRKIVRFQNALHARGSHLSKEDWKLHDELFATYVSLKQGMQGTKIEVPAHSHRAVDLQSFCLNSSKSSPNANDTYHWIKGDPSIPYFKKVISLAASKQIDQSRAQTLLWNLQNKTYWEDYPRDLQAILLKIDPSAPFKLPSRLRHRAKDVASDYLRNQIPFADAVSDAKDLIEGDFHNFADFANSISSSNTEAKPNQSLEEIPESNLFADVQSDGYIAQRVSLYNPSNQPQQIDLSDYFLQPNNSSVQRIGLSGPQGSNSNLESSLEDLLYGSMARFGIGFVPILGEVADTYEFLSGRDFLSSAELTPGERILSGLGMLAGGTAGFRFAERAAFAPEEFIPKFKRGYAEVAKRELEIGNRSLLEARRLVQETEETERAVEASNTLRKQFEDPSFRKTDFYVRPNGEVIPSKGYRYIRTDAPYFEELVRSGKIPQSVEGTYITFNSFESAKTAAAELQVPHDAAIKVEFDTKQISEDVKIPNGEWGKASWLEPIARDNSDFGRGGATQAVTHHEIEARRIIDLRTGKVLYGKR